MIANASPVIYGGGRKISKPLFGNNKTIRGFLAGVFAGLFTSILIYAISGGIYYGENWFVIGFLQGFGAMLGDLVGSLIKRRLKISEGEEFFLIDQLGFIIVAILITNHLLNFNLKQIVFVLILTFFLHKSMNIVAYFTKLKKQMH
ncbi:MAG: CDP-archaeol synthase [Candidatus Anstonellales archaeon]